jgi:hypothetical protein
VLNYGTDIFVTKNIVADIIYEAGYFALSKSDLTLAFLFLLLGCSLSLAVLITELYMAGYLAVQNTAICKYFRLHSYI